MGRLKEQSDKTLVVAGCLSQRYPSELAKELPEVDHFLGSSDMLRLGDILRSKTTERMLVGNPADFTMQATDPRHLTDRTHSAYVKIAEGCNRSCSFCAIPSFRGKQRSRSIADLVAEAERLAAMGTVELNLISQDTIAYGRDRDERPTLAMLAEALGDVPGIEWVRLHYLYPERLTPALVEVLQQHPRVLPYIDMPLQHAATGVLKRMRRGHGGKRLYEVVDRLRSAIDDLVFRTTFIVGHPGETDADFTELVQFVEWAEFDHVGVFLYSDEESTASFEQGDKVAAERIQERHDRLMQVQRPISRARMEARIGTEVDVLVDGVSDQSSFLLEGRWWGQALDVDGTTFLANGEARPGELRRALVTQAADYDLMADLLTRSGEWDAPPGSELPKRRKVKLRTI